MTARKPIIVLVPGGCHYPQCFDLLTDRLQKHGFETLSIKNKSVIAPGEHLVESSHDDAIGVREVIMPLIDEGKKIIVLGHSYGGIIVTDACTGLGQRSSEAGGVVHLIYCSAFVLPEGDTGATLLQNPELAAGLPSHFQSIEQDGTILRVRDEYAIDVFYNDVEPELAQKMVNSLGLQSFQAVIAPQQGCAYREIPSTYIRCEQDKAVFPHVQQYMADQAGIKDVVKLDTSHSPFLSKPDEVVAIIERIARSKVAE